MLPALLSAIEQTARGAENIQVHLSGAKNILAFPEFSDIQRAKSLFQTLEQKDVLVTLLGENKDDAMQIMIGSENNLQSMKDCSVITTTYKMGDGTRGTIGILGPTRMDYSQVVSVLNGMVKNIENVLKALNLFFNNKTDFNMWEVRKITTLEKATIIISFLTIVSNALLFFYRTRS